MTLADGQIVVRVALGLGPFDTPTSPDWTDLTSRVRSYRDRRGRTDVLREFQPGTADVVLDNGDRMLDPSNPDGLLYSGATRIGLPLCPVQIGVMWGGVEYPKFYGYLGPEAWPGDTAPHGPSGTVTLSVVDALGHSPGLPGDMWGILTASMHPDWWLRMDEQEFPVLDDESEVPNSLGAGVAVIEGTTGISRPYTATGVAPYGYFTPGLRMSGDHALRSPGTEIMPGGDEDKYTVTLWWGSSFGLIGSGDTAEVAKMVHPLTGEYRWSVHVDGDDGLAYVNTFDSAGDPLDSAVISPFASSRWDNGGSHFVVIRFDGASTELKVWFGGVSEVCTTENLLYGSDLLVGPADVDILIDEVTVWRRALDYTTEIAQFFILTGFGGMWGGDGWLERLGHFIEATGREVTSDDTEEMHFTETVEVGLWGLVRPDAQTLDNPIGTPHFTVPDTLADAYQLTIDSAAGARWATKHGFLRARSLAALTDATFAADYATPVTFTDENAALGTDEYRHAGVEVTGLRIDRVINDAAVTYMYSDTPPDPAAASQMTNRQIDRDSKNRYGRRKHELTTEWCDWVLNQQIADLLVERFAQPRQEIENLHLDPLGDADLGEWLTTTCELELACTVIYTPFGSDPITCAGLNIQQIEWNWTPERWTVDLMVAAS